ncbi:MAG: SDR family oxidoreductase [Devosiaceae bacterium]|nr:SDR family oxidoreductase [Devosiaceae bacterium MH13]
MAQTQAKGRALVIGASGGIGAAVHAALVRGGRFDEVLATARSPQVEGWLTLDLTDEASIAAAAQRVGQGAGPLRLVFDATGYLHGPQGGPERRLANIDADTLAHQFAVNAIGPALLLKHFLPLLPVEGKSVFATISARVGSISDNRLGGWYGYRAAKAALNQMVRTASIELARTKPQAICLALHPGTVKTPLSDPFAKSGVRLQSPAQSAAAMLSVIDQATPQMSGLLVAYDGTIVPF